MPQALTPLLGWEMGGTQTDQGQPAVVITLHTVVGPIRVFVIAQDAKALAASIEDAASQVQQPQLIRPVPGLMGPNGRPLTFGNNGASEPLPPPPPAPPTPDEVADDTDFDPPLTLQ